MPEFHAIKLQIRVGGAPLDDEVMATLVSALVEDDVNLPGCVELRFSDAALRWASDSRFAVGSELSVSLPGENQQPVSLITAEVTAIEVDIPQDGPTHTVVRGLEKSHRLFRGRRTIAYRNMTYSDVARKVAGRAGLSVGKIDAHTTVHPVVSQAGSSDWAFLSRLAAEIGYEIRHTDGKIDFCKPQPAKSGPAAATLTLGENLRRLRGAVTAADQVKNVNARSWDPANKKALVGRATPANRAVASNVRPSSFASTFGAPDHVSVHVPYATQAEVDGAAKALAERIADTCVELEGVADGHATLRAGKVAVLQGVGPPFDGRYVLTRTRHIVDDGGYSVAFTVSGHHDRSLLGLASGGNGAGRAETSLPGVVPAIVSDVRDPGKLARVKVKLPWLSDDYVSDWARVVSFGAGPKRGAVILPEVNDEVLVAFEHGDIRRPYVLGGLYNGKDAPALGQGLIDGQGKVNERGFFSREGHKVVFTDDPTKPAITVETKAGLLLHLDDKSKTVKIVSKGKVEVQADGDVTMTTKGNASVKANGNVNVEAQGNGALKATGNLELKGTAGVKVESSGVVQIKGSLVRIN